MCARHANCMKKRSVSAKTTAKHGLLEPVAFLMCWVDMNHQSDPNCRPKTDAVDEWMALHGELFAARFGLPLPEL